MSSDGNFDYQGEAVAAMKMAAATSGFERVKWVRVAQAWQDLGRDRSGSADADQHSANELLRLSGSDAR